MSSIALYVSGLMSSITYFMCPVSYVVCSDSGKTFKKTRQLLHELGIEKYELHDLQRIHYASMAVSKRAGYECKCERELQPNCLSSSCSVDANCVPAVLRSAIWLAWASRCSSSASSPTRRDRCRRSCISRRRPLIALTPTLANTRMARRAAPTTTGRCPSFRLLVS